MKSQRISRRCYGWNGFNIGYANGAKIDVKAG
jgi:hypothetical protein